MASISSLGIQTRSLFWLSSLLSGVIFRQQIAGKYEMMNRLGTVGIIRNMVNKPTRRIDMLDYQNDIMYIYNLLAPFILLDIYKYSAEILR